MTDRNSHCIDSNLGNYSDISSYRRFVKDSGLENMKLDEELKIKKVLSVDQKRSSYGGTTRIPFSEENRVPFSELKLLPEEEPPKNKKRPNIIPRLDIHEVERRRGLLPDQPPSKSSYYSRRNDVSQSLRVSGDCLTIMMEPSYQELPNLVKKLKESPGYKAKRKKKKGKHKGGKEEENNNTKENMDISERMHKLKKIDPSSWNEFGKNRENENKNKFSTINYKNKNDENFTIAQEKSLKTAYFHIVILSVILIAITLFRVYGGAVTKFILREGLNISASTQKTKKNNKDLNFSKTLRIASVNFISELLLYPDTYTLKALSVYTMSSAVYSGLLLGACQLISLFPIYNISKKVSKKYKKQTIIGTLIKSFHSQRPGWFTLAPFFLAVPLNYRMVLLGSLQNTSLVQKIVVGLSMLSELVLVLVTFRNNNGNDEGKQREIMNMAVTFPESYTGNITLIIRGCMELKNIIFTTVLVTMLFFHVKRVNFGSQRRVSNEKQKKFHSSTLSFSKVAPDINNNNQNSNNISNNNQNKSKSPCRHFKDCKDCKAADSSVISALNESSQGLIFHPSRRSIPQKSPQVISQSESQSNSKNQSKKESPKSQSKRSNSKNTINTENTHQEHNLHINSSSQENNLTSKNQNTNQNDSEKIVIYLPSPPSPPPSIPSTNGLKKVLKKKPQKSFKEISTENYLKSYREKITTSQNSAHSSLRRWPMVHHGDYFKYGEEVPGDNDDNEN